MALRYSVFDLFKIGIGPSSSHTVGPMVAARRFAEALLLAPCLEAAEQVRVELFGSLGATGKGHGTAKAILLGLLGESPETVVLEQIPVRLDEIKTQKKLLLMGQREIPFEIDQDLVFYHKKSLPLHTNGMRFCALNAAQQSLFEKSYYSVGGGFVVEEDSVDAQPQTVPPEIPYGFSSAQELLAQCQASGLSISALMLANEKCWRSEETIRSDLLAIWQVMQESIKRGCKTEGILPGGLKVKRRAPQLFRQLNNSKNLTDDPLVIMDWVSLYALAVNEENAAGGRIVTAPTNGAAGIIPAVLSYYRQTHPHSDDESSVRFLLTSAAIGILYKLNASISGAEVGCQGEVGSACSMAAGALTEVLGGTPEQVENAAEIAMEHNLGLTCDPIGGLVQVPCIERNAMAAVKAIAAARMALRGDGKHFVSLDKVIKTMRDTGRDMRDKYKETARGGLAVNVIEVPVNIVEC